MVNEGPEQRKTAMDTRPYLDKLVTAPHLPKQSGQVGYCSRRLIPDLSCAGIHSEFEQKREAVTTSDGRMTKTFVLNAYRTMRDIQRGIVVLNSKEEVFKVGHRQYIDQLLVDMEKEKRDKHERRMRHFNKKKNTLGFEGSFDSTAFGGNSSSWEPVSTKYNDRESTEFGDYSSFNCTPKPDSRNSESRNDKDERINLSASGFEAARQLAVSRANSATVRFTDSPQEFPSRPITNEEDTLAKQHQHQHSGGVTANSRMSTAGSTGSGYVARTDGAKRVRAHSRMALFNSLLNVVEPPSSPVRRFGSMQASGSNFSIEQFESAGCEPNGKATTGAVAAGREAGGKSSSVGSH